MCGFLLFTEFWCFAMRFSSCSEIWLSHRQNNIFVAKHLLALTIPLVNNLNNFNNFFQKLSSNISIKFGYHMNVWIFAGLLKD